MTIEQKKTKMKKKKKKKDHILINSVIKLHSILLILVCDQWPVLKLFLSITDLYLINFFNNLLIRKYYNYL